MDYKDAIDLVESVKLIDDEIQKLNSEIKEFKQLRHKLIKDFGWLWLANKIIRQSESKRFNVSDIYYINNN